MPLRNFIKENFVLVTGLALPVLLVVLFFIFSVLPKAMAVPPQYEMLYSETRYDNQRQEGLYESEFFVKDGALHARVWKSPGNYNHKKLMIYDGKAQTAHEIPYDLSKIGNVPDQTEIAVDDLRNMQLDSSKKSPDGYELDYRGSGSGGLAMDLFVGGYNERRSRLVKGAASFKVPDDDHGNYGDIEFIGWILKK